LDRAIHTAHLTFSGLDLPGNRQFRGQALIKENLRECIGIHTCDRRSRLSELQQRWPPPPEGDFTVEPNFSETDGLWLPDLRESDSAQTARLRRLLDDIFEHDAKSKEIQIVSMTSHSGSISATLRAVGHRAFGLQTGGVIPVLLRVDRLEGRRPEENVEPWKPKPDWCDGEDEKGGR